MVSGGADRTVRLWDLCADACVRVWKGHTGSVYSCRFVNAEENENRNNLNRSYLHHW
jgi:WD40 repeat protein